jgi:hypothetical protein
LFIAVLFFGAGATAQLPVDSVRHSDSLSVLDPRPALDSLQADSLSKISSPIRDSLRPVLQYPFTSDSFLYRKRFFFSFTDPVRYSISERRWEGKEVVFYSVVALLLVFALIKNSFRRYMADLFSSYFRTTVRQRQIKEQLLQNPLPSVLFNVFFVLSGGLFLALLFQRFALAGEAPFWMLALYAALALAVIYVGKFVVLKFFGWAFGLKDFTETYIFIVFSTNKILGIVLLPFVVLLGFAEGALGAAATTLGLIVVAGLFAYRYFLSYISISRTVQLNFFHFLLYLAAFEVLPLLLINKLLFVFLKEIT